MLEEFRGEDLAAAHPKPEMWQALLQIGAEIEQCTQQRRHHPEPRHLMTGELLHQSVRIAQNFVADDDRGYTLQQRPEELPDRIDEVCSGLLAADFIGGEWIFLPHPVEAVQQLSVLHRNALGLIGGTGGIDYIGELLRRAAGCKICVRVLPQQLAIPVKTE